MTDQDFIDNDYSRDPLDYGLAAGTKVLVPSTAITHAQAWEYQAGTNPDGDITYCELT